MPRTVEEVNESWRACYQNAWDGFRLIRETIETLGPPGSIPSEEYVLAQYGPEPIHEAQAISDALQRLLSDAPREPYEGLPPRVSAHPQPR